MSTPAQSEASVLSTFFIVQSAPAPFGKDDTFLMWKNVDTFRTAADAAAAVRLWEKDDSKNLFVFRLMIETTTVTRTVVTA